MPNIIPKKNCTDSCYGAAVLGRLGAGFLEWSSLKCHGWREIPLLIPTTCAFQLPASVTWIQTPFRIVALLIPLLLINLKVMFFSGVFPCFWLKRPRLAVCWLTPFHDKTNVFLIPCDCLDHALIMHLRATYDIHYYMVIKMAPP